MRKQKKLLALLLAMVLAAALAVPAFAEEDTASVVPEAGAAAPAYTDVSGWSKEYIDRVTELKLIDGKTADTFAPSDNMTREVMAVALYRMAGSPELAEGTANPFTDVADDAVYKNAVIWAAEKKIVAGKTADTFAPEADITRQEIAKMMNLYAAYAVKAEKLVSREDAISSYPDAASVSAWAKDFMNWAVASEFITGSNGNLDPKGTATRAQVAAILCRYLDDASTGDASLDKARNEDGIGSKELLVVSFGTSFNDSRRLTVGAIEDALEKAFPGYSVRRGFTSNIIIEHVARRDGEIIDDVTEALERAKANGVKELLVQPTHLMNGYEYSDLANELAKYAGDFDSIKIGAPLLTTDDDFAKVAQAMVDATASYDDGKTAICFMGHGTEAASNGIYAKMQQILTDGGHTNYFIGTVEAHPSVEDVLKLVKDGRYERVVLRPMMIVAGDHANNDMAGDDADSWKSVFEANGFEGKVICEVKGLGELKGVQDVLVNHAKNAKALDATDVAIDPDKAEAAPASLADGVYTIEVESNAKMFKVVACELTVAGDKMTAVLTLSGTGYDKLFVGTKAEAEAAAEGFIPFVEDADGKYTYTVSVSALDEELPFASHSAKKDEWYDRGLTFVSSTAAAK